MVNSSEIKIAPVEFWVGDSTLLTRPCAAILNSRQAKYLTGDTPWIKATLSAAAYAAKNEMTLITGLGLPSWEMGLWATGEVLGFSATLVPVPTWANIDKINRILTETITDFGLMPQQALMIPYYEENPKSPKKSWLARDQWILDHVSTLLPVSIRKKGFFYKFLDGQSKRIVDRFNVDHDNTPRFIPSIPDTIRPLDDLGEWDYLTHWTRCTPRAWPGETSSSFYGDIIDSKEKYPRSAFATLKHILDEQLLRASGWRMTQKTPMVAFSSAHPAEMLKNMIWRPAKVGYSFEPYGIAIKKRATERLGIKKVRYGTSEEKKQLSAVDRIFFQTDNSEDDVWKKEREYRFRGDLKLTSLDPVEILVLVPTEWEKEIIRAEYGLPAYALTDE